MTHCINWRAVAFNIATALAVAVVAACAAGLIGAVILNACEGLG